ncbi:MAG: CDP-alcohol phosphatidyltransferase family protein [Coxiellaceae bacterium]|nr:CDP-alcohol phosphatidyltransferase family protein [Coxiellaceae bacterium]
MLETYWRPTLQHRIFNPLAMWLHQSKRITPNGLTYAAGITGILSAICIGFAWPWIAVLLLIISGLLDVLDGTLARLTQLSSHFGCVLDIVMDRIVEFSIIAGLFSVDSHHRAALSLAMLGSTLLCVTSFLVVGIFSQSENNGKGFHYSPGLIERAEAFIFFIAMILLPSWFSGLAIAYTILVLVTTIIRLVQFKHHEDQLDANH